MLDGFDGVLLKDSSSSSSLSDRMKEYLHKMLPFTVDNRVEQQITEGEEGKDVHESPRRLRRQTVQDECEDEDVVFDMEWAFEVILPLLKGGEVSEAIGEMLVESAHANFMREPLLMDLNFSCEETETIVVGDIHGQFQDLIVIFENFGRPGPNRRYIFNGDIIDRGPRSVACWLFLCALKTAEPEFLFVTRGNHETRTISILNSSFAFECFNSYSQKFYLLCQKVFDDLPVSYTLNRSIFVRF